MQHNQGLQRSDYRIEYITTCTSHPRLVANRVGPDQTLYPAAPDLGPHCPPRPVCPNRTDPCHAMHTLQRNQDLQCSEYIIKYITTCKHFTSQMSSRMVLDQTFPTASDLGPHYSPRPGHAMHSRQHNQGLHCPKYRLKYITTCKNFTFQMSNKQNTLYIL